jgi:hypothetical protein
VLLPNPGIIQLELTPCIAPNADRKTAGHPQGARLFTRKDVKMDH